jgi:hypothetical protein
MAINLINTFEDFCNLMRKNGYWTNPDYKPKPESLIGHDKPSEYPCVVVHGHRYDSRRCGGDGYFMEYVYLEDFELGICEGCKEIKNDLIYGYPNLVDKINDWGRYCKTCIELNEET